MSLDRLVDTKRYVHRGLYDNDAQYHAEVAQMEMLVDMMQMALQDEGIEPALARRVLERVVLGATPHRREAYARVDERVGGIQQPYSPTFDHRVRGISPFPDGRAT